MGAEMHPGGIHPAEERLVRAHLTLHEVDPGGRRLVVDRLHTLFGERAGILDGLPADPAKAGLLGRIVAVRRLAAEDAARADSLPDHGITWIIPVLRVFLGIEVVKVAEEFVEAVHCRQVFVAVAEMVLAELPGGVTERLEQLSERYVARLQTDRRARNPYFRQSGPQRALAGDEGRSSRRAALLGVVVSEHHAFSGDAVDVRGAIAHHTERICADIGLPDIVAKYHQNVRLLSGGRHRLLLRLRHNGI